MNSYFWYLSRAFIVLILVGLALVGLSGLVVLVKFLGEIHVGYGVAAGLAILTFLSGTFAWMMDQP